MKIKIPLKKLFSHKPKQLIEGYAPITHKHNWKLVAINDEYYTEYTDTGEKQFWSQRFYKCSCGARHYKNDLGKHNKHSGVEKARLNWLEEGLVPKNSYHPKEKGYKKI